MGYFSIKELGLPENSWAAFETHYPSVSFPPGRMIYLQGSSADRFYYLKAGRVKVFLNSEDGSEKILTVYEAGNVFGEASFFDELPRVSSAITVTCCEIVIIDRLTLEAEMQRNPQILLTITRVLARTVRMLSDHVDTMAFLRADQRIARYLLSVPEDEAHVIHCTQEEIAAAVSVSRVTASRVLNRFVRCGLLQTGYGSLRILDASGLEQCARQGFEA